MAALVLVGGCSSVGVVTEQWHIDGSHPDYPPSRFVVGIGFGDSAQQADDMARGEVSKFFQASVVSVTREEEIYHQKREQGVTQLQQSFESRTYTRVRGEAKLEGVEIPLRTQELGRYYSLAVLDKPRFTSRLRRELMDLDMKIQESMQADAGTPAQRIRHLARVVRLLQKRVDLARRLRVLGFAATLDPETYDGVLMELHGLLVSHYSMTVRSDSPEVSAFLVEALRKEGFHVLDGDSELPVVLVTVDMQTETRPDGRMTEVFYQTVFTCLFDGRQVAVRRLSERMKHIDELNARQKAFYEMRDKGVVPFVEAIRREFLGSDEEE